MIRDRFGNARLRNPLFRLSNCRQAGYPLTDDVNGYQQEDLDDLTARPQRSEMECGQGLSSPRHGSSVDVKTGFGSIKLWSRASERWGQVTIRGRRTTRGRRDIAAEGPSIRHSFSCRIVRGSFIGHTGGGRSGVGAALEDHAEVSCSMRTQSVSCIALKWWRQPVGAQWLFGRRGIGATNHFRPVVSFAAMSTWLIPIFSTIFSRLPFDTMEAVRDMAIRCMSVLFGRMLADTSNTDSRSDKHPEIVFNYLSTDQDRQVG